MDEISVMTARHPRTGASYLIIRTKRVDEEQYEYDVFILNLSDGKAEKLDESALLEDIDEILQMAACGQTLN